jgi:hypothetical protein
VFLIKSLPRTMGFERYLELLGTLLPLYEEVATSRVFEDGKTIVYVIYDQKLGLEAYRMMCTCCV